MTPSEHTTKARTMLATATSTPPRVLDDSHFVIARGHALLGGTTGTGSDYETAEASLAAAEKGCVNNPIRARNAAIGIAFAQIAAAASS